MVIENKLNRVEQRIKLFQDDLLNEIHERAEEIDKTNNFIKTSILLHDKLIEGAFGESPESLKKYLPVANRIKQQFNLAYSRRNAKYNINKDIDHIDKERFIVRLNLLPQLLQILITKDKHLPDELYKSLTPKQKIASFSILKDDWDTYSALRVSKTTIKNALAFYDGLGELADKICFVYPTVDGKVGMDFKNKKNRVEIKFVAPGNIDAALLDSKKTLIESMHFNKRAEAIDFLKSTLDE